MTLPINKYPLEKYKDLILEFAPKHEIFKIYDLLRSLNLNKREFIASTELLFELRNYMISEGLIEFAPKSNLYVKLTPKGRSYNILKNQDSEESIFDLRKDFKTNLDKNKNITNPPKEKAETQKPKTLLKEYIGSSKRLITGLAALIFTFIIGPTIFEKYKALFINIWDSIINYLVDLF